METGFARIQAERSATTVAVPSAALAQGAGDDQYVDPLAGLTDSGGEAKQVISEGKVRLNGVVETQKRKKVRAGDRVAFGDETLVVAVG